MIPNVLVTQHVWDIIIHTMLTIHLIMNINVKIEHIVIIIMIVKNIG